MRLQLDFKEEKKACNRKIKFIIFLGILLILVFAGCGKVDTQNSENSEEGIISYPDPGIKENLPDKRPTAGEDFYLYVNYDEIKNMELPAGKSNYSTLSAMADKAEEITKELIEAGDFSDENHTKVSILYKEYLDMDKRNAEGFSSVTPYVKKVEEVSSIAEYIDLVESDPVYRIINDITLCNVSVDYKGEDVNVVYIKTPGLYLEDAEEYSNTTELGELYKEADDIYFEKILLKYGYSKDIAKKMINDAYAEICNILPELVGDIYVKNTFTEEEKKQQNFYVTDELYEKQRMKCGVGRYDLLKAGIDDVKSEEDMFNLIDSVSYAQSYNYETCNYDARSEYIGENPGWDYYYVIDEKNQEEVKKYLDEVAKTYNSMSRQELKDDGTYWESSFTTIANCSDKTMRVRFYEDDSNIVELSLDK